MKRTFTLLFVFFAMFALPVIAGNIVVNNENSTELKVVTNTYSNLQFQSTIADINFIDVKSEEGMFTLLNIIGYGYSLDVGDPKLPMKKELIEIPYGSDISVNILNSSYIEFYLEDEGIYHQIIPSQRPISKSEDPEMIDFEMNQDTYSKNEFLGHELVSVTELGTMRGTELARLEISPVQYNPVTQVLRVYDLIEVEIAFNGDERTTLENKTKLFSPYHESIFNALLNYKPVETRELILSEPVTYIIVSDPMFEDALQPVVEWKTKKGFNVVEAYTDDPNVGSTTGSISSYLEDFYNNPPTGFNPQSFVLFVGDVAQIPTFSGNAGGHVTDLYYCEYSGDLFPEAYYGRFSANNLGELQPQIDKTLEYEQYTMPDPSYLDEVLMVVGNDEGHEDTWGNGQINYGTDYYFNAEHGIYSHTFLQDPPNGNGAVHDSIIANMNSGISYGNYSAHCSPSGWAEPSFVISDINSLNNAHMYPLLVGNCCSSVEFQTTCFGEEILRAENAGALGYVGGSNSTYWDEDYWWGVGYEPVSANPTYDPANLGAYDRTFHDHGEDMAEWYNTQGQLPAAGNLAVTQSGSSLEVYYWEIYHLMGDPSLMVYFSQPPDATANYAGLLPVGATTFVVNTDPYAYVGLSKDGVLHGAALADETGYAEIEIFDPIVVPGIADIVITGQNLKPYIGTVQVQSPEGPYVLYDSYEIDDNQGNNNGMADYSENILLDVTLTNLGVETGTNISASITSDSDDITITDDSSDWPDIPADESATIDGAFAFTVNDFIENGTMASFDIMVTDGDEEWESTFSVTLYAPVLTFNDYSIDDQSGNGMIEPGETADLIIQVKNTGGADASGVIGTLSVDSPYVTLNTEVNTYGDVAADQVVERVYSITADEATPTGHYVEFTIDYTADMGYEGTGSFTEAIGQIPVIIVDLDPNTSSGPAMQTAMEANGIVPEYSTSIPADLNLYSTVFLCLGIYSTNYTLESGEGQELADWLSQGGGLYMEGGDTWAFDSQTAVHGMFNINGTDDGSADMGTVSGFTGTFTEGMSFSYSGENNWMDHLEPVGSAFSILANQSPAYNTAIAYDAGDYKTIGASHEFGGLDDAASPSTKEELMAEYLDFFGVGGGGTGCAAFFTADVTTIGAGGTVNFTDLSVGDIISWEWTFEGGTPATSSEENPSVVYNDAGDFDVTLTVSDGTNTDTYTKEEYIHVTVGVEELSNVNGINIFPNPFVDQLTIQYGVKELSDVKVAIYNVYGQEVVILEDELNKSVGQYQLDFDAEGLTSGVYYITITANGIQTTQKVVMN